MLVPSHMYARYETEFLKQLCEIWPDPKSGKPGLSPSALANAAGFSSRQTVHNYFEGREPDSEGKKKLGKFFKIIYFTDDWDEHIDNSKVLEKVKAFLQTNVYGKAI